MEQEQTQTKNACQYCKNPLRGRSDQKFCNDTCRNTFNREKRIAERITEHENTQAILRIIKRNYEILKKCSPQQIHQDDCIFVETKDFFAKGINPKFITSVFIDEYGRQWLCVFERGFYVKEKQIFIKDFPDQAEI